MSAIGCNQQGGQCKLHVRTRESKSRSSRTTNLDQAADEQRDDFMAEHL